jgi:uncharacterized protein involved in cysteine biosynthesis
MTLIIFSFDISSYAIGVEQGWLAWLSSIFIILVGLLASAIISWLMSMILGGWFLEQIAAIGLRDAGLQQPTDSRGFVASTLRSLVDESWKAILIGFVLLLTFVLSFFPPLALLVMAIGVFLIGLNVFDLPLTVHGLSFRERKNILLTHKKQVLCIGAAFSAVLVVPFAFLIAPQLFAYLTGRYAGLLLSFNDQHLQ